MTKSDVALLELRKANSERERAYAECERAGAAWNNGGAQREKAYAAWEKAYAHLHNARAKYRKVHAEWKAAKEQP